MTLGHFLLAHWVLSSVLIVVCLGLLWNEWANRLPKGVQVLEPGQLVLAINRQKAQVFDVRDPLRYKEGHITGALNIPIAEIGSQKALWERFQDGLCVLVGETGQESLKAIRLVQSLSKEKSPLSQWAVLSGGMHAWRGAQLPVIS